MENDENYFGALTKGKYSDIVILVTDKRTESEQPKMKKRCYIYTIESVEIYPEKLDNGRMLKQINFNFPVYYDVSVVVDIGCGDTKEHIDISNLTIEHILPQKENAAVWKKEVLSKGEME